MINRHNFLCPLIFVLPAPLHKGLGFDGRAGVNGSGYLHKPRHCVIEEALVAFAEIAFPAEVVFPRSSIFHTAAATDGKMSADQAFVGQILLGQGKCTLFTAGG